MWGEFTLQRQWIAATEMERVGIFVSLQGALWPHRRAEIGLSRFFPAGSAGDVSKKRCLKVYVASTYMLAYIDNGHGWGYASHQVDP